MKLKEIKKLFTKNSNIGVRYKKEKINYTQLKELLKKENAILIDVRSKQEYDEGHLNYAINIPYYEIHFEITKKVKNRQDCIIVYCQSGVRSCKALEELKNLNYNNIYELEGGLDQIY